VSVIIVNHNGKHWLGPCLDSLFAQTHPNIEIILIDNASSDGSSPYLRNTCPAVRLIETDLNIGFAGGNNLGVSKATGEYVFFLNNDTVVDPNCIERLISTFDQLPQASILQPKMVLLNRPDRLDVCGAYWTDTTFLYYHGHRKPSDEALYATPRPYFSIKGAAMIMRRRTIEEYGLFDPTFWCYYEETDLCHRHWLLGLESWYVPAARVLHYTGGTARRINNSLIEFHNIKNKLRSFLKNFEGHSLLRILPTFLVIYSGLSLAWLIQGKFQHLFVLPKAVLWNLIHLRSTLRQRTMIQSQRQLSDAQIFERVRRNPRWEYYRLLFTNRIEHYLDDI